MKHILRSLGITGKKIVMTASVLLLLAGVVGEFSSANATTEKWILTSYETYDGHGFNTGGGEWPSGMPQQGENGLSCSVTADERTYTNTLTWTRPPHELTLGQTFTLEAHLAQVDQWGPLNGGKGTAAALNGSYNFDHFPCSIPAGTLTSVATGNLECRMGSCGGQAYNQDISVPVTFKGCSSSEDCSLVWKVFGCQESPDHYLWITYRYTKESPKQPIPKPRTQSPKREQIARIKSMKGDVMVRKVGEDWHPLTGGSLGVNDEISTGPDSLLIITFPDGTTLQYGELTRGLMSDLQTVKDRIMIRVLLKMGEIRSQVPKQELIRSDFSIKSPTATAGVRGTRFTVRYDEKSEVTTVTVEDGVVRVTPENRSLRYVDLQAGQQVQVTEQTISAVPSGRTGPTGPGGPVVQDVPTSSSLAQQGTRQVCNITGQWQGVNGDLFEVFQDGRHFSWKMSNHGNESAVGTIDGSSITVSWSGDIHGSGSATGTVECDGRGWATRILWGNGAVFNRTEHKAAQGLVETSLPTCNISGQWLGINNDLFEVTQTGNSYTWTMLNKGRENATGSIIGRDITVSWTGDVHGSGTAYGKVECAYNLWGTRIGWNNGAVFVRAKP